MTDHLLPKIEDYALDGDTGPVKAALMMHFRHLRNELRRVGLNLQQGDRRSCDAAVFHFFQHGMEPRGDHKLAMRYAYSAAVKNRFDELVRKMLPFGHALIQHWQAYAKAFNLTSFHWIDERDLDPGLIIGIPDYVEYWEGLNTWLHDEGPVSPQDDDELHKAIENARWLVHEYQPLDWDPEFRLYLREERT